MTLPSLSFLGKDEIAFHGWWKLTIPLDRKSKKARMLSDSERLRFMVESLPVMELSIRATNCLESVGITTVRDLVLRTEDELLEIPNFGETTLHEVQSKLEERGLQLGMTLPEQL